MSWIEIARDPHRPPEVLQELAEDEDKWVRQAVAKHSNTPLELLQQLARDKNEDAQQAARRNPDYRD